MDKRNTQRLRCSTDVLVCTTIEGRAARIVNLSRWGAKLRLDEPFAAGTRIHLDVDGDFYWATVVWSEEDRMGVRFRVPVSSGPLMGTLKELQLAAVPVARPTIGFGRRQNHGSHPVAKIC